MPKNALTDAAIRNLKAPGKHSAGETLYLKVWPETERKTWVQRITIEGKRTDLGLGPYPAVGLAQARRKAEENLSMVKSGVNPLAVKREETRVARIPTFGDLAQQHITENLHAWKNMSRAERNQAAWRSKSVPLSRRCSA